MPAGIPNAAADLQTHVNDIVWGRQANIFINVNPTVLERQVNFDFDRDGKLRSTRDDRDEFDAIWDAVHSGRDGGDPIDMYYVGVPYSTYTDPLTGQSSAAAAAAERGRFAAIFGSQGLGVSVAAHELGHIFRALDHYTPDFLGYIMYGTVQSGTPCRVGKPDLDRVQPVSMQPSNIPQ